MEIARSKKTPAWLRYPLIVLLSLLIVGILGGVLAFAVVLIVVRRGEWDLPLAIVLLVLDGIMIFSAVRKARAYIIKRRERAGAADAVPQNDSREDNKEDGSNDDNV